MKSQPSMRRLRATLLLAAAVAGLPVAHAGEWRYRVRKGENLWDIAQNNLAGPQWLQPLQQLNRIIDPMRLPPGTELLIPLAWTKRTNVAATVDAVNGDVRASGEPVSTQSRLQAGTTIQTGRDGILNMRYPDGSLTRIFGNAEVEIEQLEVLGRSAQLVARLNVRRGYTENIVRPGSVIRSSDVRVSTPHSSTSVRGTHFRVGIEDGASTAVTGVLHGRVDVANTRGRHLSVGAGEGTHVSDGARLLTQPLLPEPASDSVPTKLEALPLQLESAALPGAASYRADLSPLETPDVIIAAAHAVKPQLRFVDVPDGRYRLRLRGVDAAGLEGLDAVREIEVDARPEPPFLMQPLADATVPAGQVPFEWASRKDAREYTVEVYAADAKGQPQGAPLHSFHSRDARTLLPLEADATGRQYAWRARVATASEGVGPYGAYSNFKVVPPGPGVEPPGFKGRTMTLGWPRQPVAAKWRMQLSRDAGFASIDHEAVTSEPRYTLPRPKQGTLNVRVAWIDQAGEQGPWSQPQQIQVPARKPWWLAIPAALLLVPML